MNGKLKTEQLAARIPIEIYDKMNQARIRNYEERKKVDPLARNSWAAFIITLFNFWSNYDAKS